MMKSELLSVQHCQNCQQANERHMQVFRPHHAILLHATKTCNCQESCNIAAWYSVQVVYIYSSVGGTVVSWAVVSSEAKRRLARLAALMKSFQDCGMPFLQLILSCPYLSLKINYRSSSGHTLTVISIPPIHVHSILSVPAINVTSILFLHNSLNLFNFLHSLRLLVELTNRPSDHFNHNSLIPKFIHFYNHIGL